MAFVNKKLSISEKKKISDMKIKNPYGNYRDIMEGITPSYITIDNSSNMWLAHCYTHKETLECIEEFIFMYNGQPIPVQAKKRINGKNVIWEISRIDISVNMIVEDHKLINSLVAAFKVYNTTGWPEENDEAVSVICDLGKEDEV